VRHLAAALQRIAADLQLAGVGFAVVGGLAVSARTIPRFTRDVDLAIAVETDEDAERVVASLLTHGYRMLAQLEHLETKRFATARLVATSRAALDEDPPIIDLLFAAAGIEQEVVAAAEQLDLGSGLMAPVARIGHLLAMKLLSADAGRRPQDLVDVAVLLRAADDADIALARSSIALIDSRGCGRSKDLGAALAEALVRAGRSA
jgi:predicted nucleotidyltransferase